MEPRPDGYPRRAPVTRRKRLRAGVKIGLLVGAAGFAWVFAHGLFAPATDSSGDVIDIGGLPPGTARLDSWHGKPVWVIHRSASQLQALTGLSEHVLEPPAEPPGRIDNPHRSLRPGYGVYLAETARSGILVQYVEARPRGLDGRIPWHGGFVDPGGDAVFDVSGRRYRTTGGGPLPVPPHHYATDSVIRLGDW